MLVFQEEDAASTFGMLRSWLTSTFDWVLMAAANLFLLFCLLPGWVKWVDEPVPGYPKRTVPRDEDAAKALKKRTLTKSLQRPPAGGSPMCTTLDAAVAAAYGWSADIDDDHVLRELLALDSGGA